MLASLDDCLLLLRCPRTGLPLRRLGSDALVTIADEPERQYRYPFAQGRPVLVDFDTSVLDEARTMTESAASLVLRRRYGRLAAFARRVVSPPNPASARHVQEFMRLVGRASDHPRVLIVGGASVGDGTGPLYEDPSVSVLGFDIFGTPNVQFVADAHRIPLDDASMDGVVCQAVLEHVLEPSVVAAEVARVVKPGGLVYAETPFMQQVHEGAYDFTRFTDSGHRFLFRDFEAIASGAIAGPAVALLWSLDFFTRSVFRSRTAGKAVKLLFFWLRYFDRLVPQPLAIDAASGVYFLGRKGSRRLRPTEIIASYQGAQRNAADRAAVDGARVA